MNKIFSLGKAALVAGAVAAPLGAVGAATASAQPAPVSTQIGTPLKADICFTGPIGLVRGCVDTGQHRWWDGSRWWNGDDWHRFHDGPGWRGPGWHDGPGWRRWR